MDLTLPPPIATLLEQGKAVSAGTPLAALTAWLGRLPMPGTASGRRERARWLAKRGVEVARPARPLEGPDTPPAVALPAVANDWPPSWQSLVHAVEPMDLPAVAETTRRPRRARAAGDAVASDTLDGQAFLSLFSANANRLEDLAAFVGPASNHPSPADQTGRRRR